eukprot:gene2829-3665_t
MDLAGLQSLKPWFVATLLALIEGQKLGLDPALGLDRHLMERAAQAGKPAHGLETADTQIAMLDGLGATLQDAFLQDTLREVGDFKALFEELHSAWRTGDAAALERSALAELRDQALVLDTSLIRPTHLRSQIKDLLGATQAPLTLVFESFAFKRGIPMDADFVFDVRMLPNPHYEPDLRPLTGRDAPVAAYLAQNADVTQMFNHIEQFLGHWLDALARDHRSYVTVAIGCTGGQHRSVYLVEKLAAAFGSRWVTLKRHREMDALG